MDMLLVGTDYKIFVISFKVFTSWDHTLKWDKHAIIAAAKPLSDLSFKRTALLGAELNGDYAAIGKNDHSTL